MGRGAEASAANTSAANTINPVARSEKVREPGSMFIALLYRGTSAAPPLSPVDREEGRGRGFFDLKSQMPNEPLTLTLYPQYRGERMRPPAPQLVGYRVLRPIAPRFPPRPQRPLVGLAEAPPAARHERALRVQVRQQPPLVRKPVRGDQFVAHLDDPVGGQAGRRQR